jgi:hypothetical protein
MTTEDSTIDASGLQRVAFSVAAAVPAVIASGLVILYTAGVVIIAAELLGADVRIGDTLILVPLEQILARGVGFVFIIGATTLVILPLLVLLGMLSLRARQRRARLQMIGHSDSTSTAITAIRAGSVTLGVALLIALVVVLALPPTASIFLLIATCGSILLPVSRSPFVGVAAAYFLVAVSLSVSLFVYPPPLPDASLTGADGRVTSGPLITDTGSSYYVNTGPDEIAVVDHDEVLKAVITTKPNRDMPSTASYIRDLFAGLF